ncbi:hypothetical protein [Agrococcus jejuensis]|uniref:Uncharacterized protein n=1 Tax=Agrococcus jejuensis TaxID=399736 RepID=A0A1G8CR51_9MICO|nr:hypothetical protein [Agrococcus jejuensis]SDH47906.1 hypothetical protein SAMN04489720_1382 [Agrococcus jejuensis]
MPASVPGSPAPRSPGLALLVEQVARVVARARAQQGDAAVHDRIDSAITPEDAATAARVLRTLGRELGETPLDLGALDARLRSIARDASGDAPATPDAEQPKAPRPVPPTGLRSAMRGRRN